MSDSATYPVEPGVYEGEPEASPWSAFAWTPAFMAQGEKMTPAHEAILSKKLKKGGPVLIRAYESRNAASTQVARLQAKYPLRRKRGEVRGLTVTTAFFTRQVSPTRWGVFGEAVKRG